MILSRHGIAQYAINRRCIPALLFLFLFTPCSNADHTISTSRMQVVFSDQGDILAITPFFKATRQRVLQTTFFSPDGRPILRFEPSSGNRDSVHSSITGQNDSVTTIRFLRKSAEITYRLTSNDYAITTTLRPIAPASSSALLHLQQAIAAATDTALTPILVTRHSSPTLRKTTKSSAPHAPDIQWLGVRNRFWTLLVERGDASMSTSDTDLSLHFPGNVAPTTLRLYAGPVDYRELRKIDRSCTNLLYPLWRWLRYLSIGLLAIFNVLLSLTNNCALSIVLLSVAVKIILAPLYLAAHRLQQEVNRQKSIIEPRLREIRTSYKGEEQTTRILAVHKELGISPLYTLKSLVSAGIQIPVFFAAYHMLSENIALLHTPLLWLDDLAQPDQSLPLPFKVFLIGNRLNILPFVMTAITVASSYVHTDHSLSVSLHRQQQRSLYGMALLFFVLLYTSPAGMLLYWTMNNLLSFISSLFNLLVYRDKPESPSESEIV